MRQRKNSSKEFTTTTTNKKPYLNTTKSTKQTERQVQRMSNNTDGNVGKEMRPLLDVKSESAELSSLERSTNSLKLNKDALKIDVNPFFSKQIYNIYILKFIISIL